MIDFLKSMTPLDWFISYGFVVIGFMIKHLIEDFKHLSTESLYLDEKEESIIIVNGFLGVIRVIFSMPSTYLIIWAIGGLFTEHIWLFMLLDVVILLQINIYKQHPEIINLSYKVISFLLKAVIIITILFNQFYEKFIGFN